MLVYSKPFERNQSQKFRGSSFHVVWMRGEFVCKNYLLPMCLPPWMNTFLAGKFLVTPTNGEDDNVD